MPQFEFPFRGEKYRLDSQTRTEAPGEFVALPFGFVHYQLGGPKEGEVVILIHGLSVPYYIWDPTYDALTEYGARVLRYDLFGRGYSDRPLVRYDAALFIGQLLGLMDALEIEKAHLVGLSMGAVIAAHFIDQHPERVNKMVLIDPAGFPLGFSTQMKLMLLPGIGELLFNLLGDGNLLQSMAGDFFEPKYVEAFIERYRPQMKFKGFRRALLSTMRAGMLDDALPLYRKIGARQRPVLLIWGEEDRTVPYEHSAALVEAIPQVQFHSIEAAGHIPHYERPEAVNPILTEFLSKQG